MKSFTDKKAIVKSRFGVSINASGLLDWAMRTSHENVVRVLSGTRVRSTRSGLLASSSRLRSRSVSSHLSARSTVGDNGDAGHLFSQTHSTLSLLDANQVICTTPLGSVRPSMRVRPSRRRTTPGTLSHFNLASQDTFSRPTARVLWKLPSEETSGGGGITEDSCTIFDTPTYALHHHHLSAEAGRRQPIILTPPNSPFGDVIPSMYRTPSPPPRLRSLTGDEPLGSSHDGQWQVGYTLSDGIFLEDGSERFILSKDFSSMGFESFLQQQATIQKLRHRTLAKVASEEMAGSVERLRRFADYRR